MITGDRQSAHRRHRWSAHPRSLRWNGLRQNNHHRNSCRHVRNRRLHWSGRRALTNSRDKPEPTDGTRELSYTAVTLLPRTIRHDRSLPRRSDQSHSLHGSRTNSRRDRLDSPAELDPLV